MGWLTTPTANGTITESVKYLTENLWIVGSTVSHYKRTRTITQKRYVGLTQGAAETQAATSSALPNCTDAHTEATGAGSYCAIECVDALTDWTYIPPPP